MSLLSKYQKNTPTLQKLYQQFIKNSWCKIPFDETLLGWVKHILPYAVALVQSKDNQQWFRYQHTWFAGVNILPNNTEGEVSGSPPLQGKAITFIQKKLGLNNIDFDPGQISVCYPGYPKPSATESKKAYEYRLNYDAAHIDGIHRVGEKRERFLREHHAFILGIPLVEFNALASPLTVWEGSHLLALNRLKCFYKDDLVEQWDEINVTSVYHELRKHIFNQCNRVTVHAVPGEAFIVHRLALHGIAPWETEATASKQGRMICYFRPLLDNPVHWLQLT